MRLNTICSAALYVYFVVLAKHVSKAEYTSEDNEIRTGNSVNSFTEDNQLLSRQLRSVFLTDHGYGTRLQAGSNAARLTLGGSVYGIQGPGKRSSGYFEQLRNGAGYGSRNALADRIAYLNSRAQPFGRFGPGKRSYDQMLPSYDELYDDSAMESEESFDTTEESESDLKDFDAEKRSGSLFHRLFRSGYGGDSGYGSRISAGTRVADNNAAYENVFGGWGVGKRKRSVEVVPDVTAQH